GKPGCTCPDHESRGTVCKHIRALAAIGLLKIPKEKTGPTARGLKAHAKNARAAIAEAKQLSPEARRHLAAMGPEPAPIRGTDRRAALVGRPRGRALETARARRGLEPGAWAGPASAGIVLPEGWQLGGAALRPAAAPAAKALPPVPAGSFTAGF